MVVQCLVSPLQLPQVHLLPRHQRTVFLAGTVDSLIIHRQLLTSLPFAFPSFSLISPPSLGNANTASNSNQRLIQRLRLFPSLNSHLGVLERAVSVLLSMKGKG